MTSDSDNSVRSFKTNLPLAFRFGPESPEIFPRDDPRSEAIAPGNPCAIIVLLESIVHSCRKVENAEQKRRRKEDQERAKHHFDGEALMIAQYDTEDADDHNSHGTPRDEPEN